MYSFKVEQAIKAATVLHKNQVRKGEFPMPYVSHAFSVAFILSDYTEDENVIAAALLHDTLEDTDYSEKELLDDFGPEITKIVKAVTEPKGLSWDARKKKYESSVKRGGEPAKLVSCADKIHNMRSTIEEYYDDQPRFQADFGKKAKERLQHYENLGEIFNKSLNSDIVQVYDNVLTEYKIFTKELKKPKNA